MQGLPYDQMLEAGVHFGHLKKKWNPKMLPYIFMEHKGIHIIDLNKTNEALITTGKAVRSIARSGRKILFVATKKQAKDIVAEAARGVGMPYVTERWLGGMLTNFATIKKSIKKMQGIERTLTENADALTKKERLMLGRQKDKLERVLGGIANLNRVPSALFIVDISHEHIALAEADKLNLNTFAIVDTNSDPTSVDYAIPANDDASKSVNILINYIADQIREGLLERDKEQAANPSRKSSNDGNQDSGRGKRRSRGRRKKNK
ncbi:MAG: 30S ribosomal protein S2 [Chitinophagales bacterium]